MPENPVKTSENAAPATSGVTVEPGGFYAAERSDGTREVVEAAAHPYAVIVADWARLVVGDRPAEDCVIDLPPGSVVRVPLRNDAGLLHGHVLLAVEDIQLPMVKCSRLEADPRDDLDPVDTLLPVHCLTPPPPPPAPPSLGA